MSHKGPPANYNLRDLHLDFDFFKSNEHFLIKQITSQLKLPIECQQLTELFSTQEYFLLYDVMLLKLVENVSEFVNIKCIFNLVITLEQFHAIILFEQTKKFSSCEQKLEKMPVSFEKFGVKAWKMFRTRDYYFGI